MVSNEELRSNLAILFSAGHDTTSGSLSTVVYHLVKNPSTQSKARDEVIRVLQYLSEPTLQDLSNLPYLTACIKEALRINPPISLGKYYIPPRPSIIPNVHAVQRNTLHWSDPSTFDPDRFLNVCHKPAANIPFGIGPRQCVARQFSSYEQRTLLSMLLLRYEWSLPLDSPHAEDLRNEFGAFGLSIPHDLDLQFSSREMYVCVDLAS